MAKNGVAAACPVDIAGVRIGQVHVVGRRRVGERCSRSDIVNVVTLKPFVEGSEAATEYGFAVSEDIFGEANAGLQSLVVVLDQSSWGSALTSQVNTVQIERCSIDRLEAGAVGSMGSVRSPYRSLAAEVRGRIEVRDQVVALPSEWQRVVAKPSCRLRLGVTFQVSIA